MKKFWESFGTKVDVLKKILYVLGIVAAIATSIVYTIDTTLDAKLDKYFDANINDRFANIEARLTTVEDYEDSEKILMILKQYDKIKSEDFDDIKRSDLEACIRWYPTIVRVTDDLTVKYKLVLEYYAENFI